MGMTRIDASFGIAAYETTKPAPASTAAVNSAATMRSERLVAGASQGGVR
jgi:hypothetical protein